MRRRGRVREVISGHDEGRRLDSHNLLRLRAGRGIAVKENATARFHDPQVTLLVLRREGLGKAGVAGNAWRPGTRFRILPEAALFSGALDEGRESPFPHQGGVAGEILSPLVLPPVAP